MRPFFLQTGPEQAMPAAGALRKHYEYDNL